MFSPKSIIEYIIKILVPPHSLPDLSRVEVLFIKELWKSEPTSRPWLYHGRERKQCVNQFSNKCSSWVARCMWSWWSWDIKGISLGCPWGISQNDFNDFRDFWGSCFFKTYFVPRVSCSLQCVMEPFSTLNLHQNHVEGLWKQIAGP